MEPNLFNLFEQCSDLNFKPFDITEYNCCDFETNIDPNNNFYNNIRSPFKYYTEDQFAALKKRKSGISFIHFNARGLRTNFNKIDNILNECESPLDVIAISETWLESDDCNIKLGQCNTRRRCKYGLQSLYRKISSII